MLFTTNVKIAFTRFIPFVAVLVVLGTVGCSSKKSPTPNVAPAPHASVQNTPDKPDDAATAESPWPGFGPGSSVTIRVSRQSRDDTGRGSNTVTESTFTLVKPEGNGAALKVVETVNGIVQPGYSVLELPSESKQIGSGTETLTIGGRAVECTWVEIESKDQFSSGTTKTWSSTAVPGGMVRSVGRGGNGFESSTVTREVTAFKVVKAEEK
jgi:hypothetical protein